MMVTGRRTSQKAGQNIELTGHFEVEPVGVTSASDQRCTTYDMPLIPSGSGWSGGFNDSQSCSHPLLGLETLCKDHLGKCAPDLSAPEI